MKITSLNLWTLKQLMQLSGDGARCPNKFGPADLPHIRRCAAAGLVTVEGKDLVLTPAGAEAIAKAGA